MKEDVYLALETGGTKLVAAVARSGGVLIDVDKIYRTPGDIAETSLARLIELARSLREKHEAEGNRFRAIGVGFGGLVERSNQRAYRCLHENGWADLDVPQILHDEFGIPAFLENDCNVAALAEACVGAGVGYRTVFYVTIGTGVGGGIVRECAIQEFGTHGEAEIGHITVVRDGPPCGCGSSGCVEAICSGPGIRLLAVAMADGAQFVASSLATRIRAGEPITTEEIFAAWNDRDDLAIRVLDEVAGHLGFALSCGMNLVCPDLCVLGGGVGSSSDRFVALVCEKARPFVVPYFRRQFSVVRSVLKDDVVTTGAALLAEQRLHMQRDDSMSRVIT